MTETTAISATRRQIRELVDGTIEVKLHIDPRFRADFHRLFPEIDAPVALAPLKADFEQPKEEKPKGGPLSKSAAQMCEYAPFQAFLRIQHARVWIDCEVDSDPQNSHSAAVAVRCICGIGSRAELDHKPDAAKRFQELMREYREWNEGKQT